MLPAKETDRIVKELADSGPYSVLLHGLVQSGKTHTFLSVMNALKDKGYSKFFIITKSSLNLVSQTMTRAKNTLDNDVKIYEIKKEYNDFAEYELEGCSVFVIKKNVSDFKKAQELLAKYPLMKKEKALIIIDEVDEASVGFVKNKASEDKEELTLRKICQSIEDLKMSLDDFRFLTVTATPFVQYLSTRREFKPHSVILLQPHNQYFGTKQLFLSEEKQNRLMRENYVSEAEEQRINEDEAPEMELIKCYPALTKSLLSFVIGGTIRHFQLDETSLKHFSMLCHTATRKDDHSKFKNLLLKINAEILIKLEASDPYLLSLLQQVYENLIEEVEPAKVPPFELVYSKVKIAFKKYIKVTIINSENKFITISDEGQIVNKTPFSIFIGAYAVERGITFSNLITFLYTRPLKSIYVESVIQHMRICGARDKDDLKITRMFATEEKINKFIQIADVEETIRNNIEIFVEAMKAGEESPYIEQMYNILPALEKKMYYTNSNKISSKINLYRANSRITPWKFSTIKNQKLAQQITNETLNYIAELNQKYKANYISPNSKKSYISISSQEAINLVNKVYSNLHWLENVSTLKYEKILFFLKLFEAQGKDEVHLYVAENRNRSLKRNTTGIDGKIKVTYDNSPDSGSSGDYNILRPIAADKPLLMLFKQNGSVEKGFDGVPFFWPILVLPSNLEYDLIAT